MDFFHFFDFLQTSLTFFTFLHFLHFWITQHLTKKSLVSPDVSQSVDLGRSINPNTTPTKDYKNVRVVVYLHGVQRGCAEEGERGSTPTG